MGYGFTHSAQTMLFSGDTHVPRSQSSEEHGAWRTVAGLAPEIGSPS